MTMRVDQSRKENDVTQFLVLPGRRFLRRARKRDAIALDRNDTEELRRVVKALWQLLPDDSEARKRGFDSGVR